MNTVTPASIKPLLRPDDKFTVSIYMPTHRYPTGSHIKEDKIRLKNCMREAKAALSSQKADDEVIRKIGNKLEDIYSRSDFWEHMTEGLAVFCTIKSVSVYHLPMECAEMVRAGSFFDITPLHAVISYDIPFYALALAEHSPSLYKGDMYGIEAVDIEFPKSPEEALHIDELFSNSQTVRSGNGNGPGNPSFGSHGQGDSRRAGTEERLEYFKILDDIIQSAPAVDKSLPLLIAGLDDEISGYRKRSQHKHLVATVLEGNFTPSSGVNINKLHSEFWTIMTHEVGHSRRKAFAQKFQELHGQGRASVNFKEISEAARNGRIDVLLMSVFVLTNDTVRDNSEPATKLIYPSGHDNNEIDACARSVFDHSGTVIGLYKDEMPDKSNIAALLRY